MNVYKEFADIWKSSAILLEAFDECKLAIRQVYEHIDDILASPAYVPAEYRVEMDEIPDVFYSIHKNIFSTLFQSTYSLLGVNKQQRLLYARLNHLFRIWVTSADNLLDDEDKLVLPMTMAEGSHIMEQVVAIMAADRALNRILNEALDAGIISKDESKLLSDKSLQVLLPSAAEEASEEKGISQRPEADYVLETIHRFKTGILFHIPFLGPEIVVGNIDLNELQKAKYALDNIGLGCQLLDDIKDINKDYVQKRHNYVLSLIENAQDKDKLSRLALLASEEDLDKNLYSEFKHEVELSSSKARAMINSGLIALGEMGLGIDKLAANLMVDSLFMQLGIGDLL